MKVNWINEKETLDKLIKEGVSYERIAKHYDVSRNVRNGINKTTMKYKIYKLWYNGGKQFIKEQNVFYLGMGLAMTAVKVV